MNWVELGRFLIIAGTVIIVLGLVFMLSDKFPIGKLPGDIQLGNERFKIYIPFATSIFLSVILTIILNFFMRK
ncbi:DUF2905 domain-containing protein [Chitinispirillales bacterium ANBcel5]|uniref:DUF2905 domain-containing protein n=1 Tax=Cellulosispirillum alkaliphilum TaxID=3039283 RepID=UPI002A4F7273|nr:DUF2905 domain-containing protein [Chitinispirillales bacterium ANBcel5]